MSDTSPQRSAFVELITDPNIQRWIERLVMAAIAAYFGVKINSVHNSVESTKDVATNTNEVQKAVATGTNALVQNQIGDIPAAKELTAATMPTK